MKTTNSSFFLILYLALLGIFLLLIPNSFFGAEKYIIPPTLDLLLILYFLVFSDNTKQTKIKISTGLIFSFLGYLAFLFTPDERSGYLLSLFAYAIAKVCYISNFFSTKSVSVKRLIPITVILVSFGTLFLFLIWKNVYEALIPVVAYMLLLFVLVKTTFLRKNMVNNTSYILAFLGSLFLLLCNAVFALDLCYTKIAYAEIYIYVFFYLGKLCIVLGTMEQRVDKTQLKTIFRGRA
ncbi:lysoplasmalogenase family protein [Zhouia sp. PK063]|uniref:lysoplasmalogenase family protein n=1 Tax=Zhouia sp. PK063 TaxID=3373602 RepID=UPI00379D46E5